MKTTAWLVWLKSDPDDNTWLLEAVWLSKKGAQATAKYYQGECGYPVKITKETINVPAS